MKNQVVVLATGNLGKIKEIRELLKNSLIQIKDLSDFGPIPEVEENGKTFDDNAYIKSSFTAKVLGLPAIAEDSGLVVEALGGAPGVYSARYAGKNASDEEKYSKLLKEMEGVKNRSAYFECVFSIAIPSGMALTYEARCKGMITDKPMGKNGFGYDPVFLYPPLKKTFGEMTIEEKGRVSHRGKALIQIKNEIDKILIWLDNQIQEGEKFDAGKIYCNC